MERRERIAGGLYGLLIGDALGVPYEFSNPKDLPTLDRIEMTPPPDFRRAHPGVPAGTYSDDGAQALCLLASLLERGRLDLEDFAGRLLAWLDEGRYAVAGEVFDVGIQTQKALARVRGGAPAHQAGGADDRSNGNGSLMRVLPLALWHQGGDAELVADAHLQSLPTHAHPRSQACCAFYCLWARYLLAGLEHAEARALHTLRTIYGTTGSFADELREIFPEEGEGVGTGSGYVVDCLHSALRVMAFPTYETVVKQAIALGNDTDTTACVAGGVAGIRDGEGAIPARWMASLRGRDLVAPLLERLLAGR